MRILQTDVVVVGGGAAGCYAALRLRELGLRGVLVSKGLVGKSGASIMAGAIIVGSRMLGGTEANARATLNFFARYYSHFLVDQSYLAECGDWIESRFYPELEEAGLMFRREADGRIAMSHSSVRWAISPMQGQTGILMMDIRRKQLERAGVPVLEECAVTRLVRDSSGRVCGVVALQLASGELIAVIGRAVILATGHADRLVRRSTGTREQTGDGIALAMRAGAELTNLEMQFWHTSDFAAPPTWQRLHIYPNPLVGTSLSARMYNSEGECFFDQSADVPDALAPYSMQVKRLTQQVMAGKARFDGGYYTSYDHIDGETIRKYQYHAAAFEKVGLDPARDKVETRTTMHYRQGGIECDPHTMKSTVPGLLVAGGVGGHVTGSLAVASYDGHLAAQTVAAMNLPPLPRAEAVQAELSQEAARLQALRRLMPADGIAPMRMKTRIWDVMGEAYGIVKTGDGMRRGLAELAALRELAQDRMGLRQSYSRFDTGWQDAIDVHNLLDVCEVTLHSALQRTESRGNFYRADYPVTDNRNWLCKNVVRAHEGRFFFRTEAYPPGPLVPEFERKEFFDVPW